MVAPPSSWPPPAGDEFLALTPAMSLPGGGVPAPSPPSRLGSTTSGIQMPSPMRVFDLDCRDHRRRQCT